jgi:hypothetical protein
MIFHGVNLEAVRESEMLEFNRGNGDRLARGSIFSAEKGRGENGKNGERGDGKFHGKSDTVAKFWIRANEKGD